MARKRKTTDQWLKERMDALDRTIEWQNDIYEKYLFKKNHPIQYIFAKFFVFILKILKPFLLLIPFGILICWLLFLDFIKDNELTTLFNILLYGPVIAFIYFVFIRRGY